MNWFMAPLLASIGTLGTFAPLSASFARTTSVQYPHRTVNPAPIFGVRRLAAAFTDASWPANHNSTPARHPHNLPSDSSRQVTDPACRFGPVHVQPVSLPIRFPR